MEMRRLSNKLKRKFNMLRIYTKDREFSYKQPQMEYNKETGDVTIIEEKKKPKRIIRSTDDLDRERKAVLKEIGLESDNLDSMDLSQGSMQQEVAEKLVYGMKKLQEET